MLNAKKIIYWEKENIYKPLSNGHVLSGRYKIKFKSSSKDYQAIADPFTAHMCIRPMFPDTNTRSA